MGAVCDQRRTVQGLDGTVPHDAEIQFPTTPMAPAIASEKVGQPSLTVDDPADERSLSSMLKAIGYHAHEAHAERNRWVPPLVDDAWEVGVGERSQKSQSLLVDSVVVSG